MICSVARSRCNNLIRSSQTSISHDNFVSV